jgi:DNA-binding beta-propeller fold protein YncE
MITKTAWVGLLLAIVIIFSGGCGSYQSAGSTPPPSNTQHFEYVFTSGFIYVYDIDHSGTLMKTLTVPTTAGVRGAVASAVTGKLYIAYGSDSGSVGSQLAYDLATDTVVWTQNYSHGVDSQAISPDGTKIFMPTGEVSPGSTWEVEDPATGHDIASISVGGTGTGSGTGPHNTIVNQSGTRVYMGLRDPNLGGGQGTNDFGIADTSTKQIVGEVTPTQSGVRPFTINSKETLAYMSVTDFLGFQVGDLTTGKVIYAVPIDGTGIPGFTTSFSVTDPSHGIALSADDSTLYLVDYPNNYVHVFDVSKVPASKPTQVANIKLPDNFTATQAQCAYDCGGDGWLHLSHDGAYLFVGDTPDVISTSTRTLAMKMPMMANSRIEIEIDFQGTTPVWAMGQRSSIGLSAQTAKIAPSTNRKAVANWFATVASLLEARSSH